MSPNTVPLLSKLKGRTPDVSNGALAKRRKMPTHSILNTSYWVLAPHSDQFDGMLNIPAVVIENERADEILRRASVEVKLAVDEKQTPVGEVTYVVDVPLVWNQPNLVGSAL
jgi:hypothetical protein